MIARVVVQKHLLSRAVFQHEVFLIAHGYLFILKSHTGFFPGETAPPPVGENLVKSPSGTRPHFPTRACPPPPDICPQNFYNLSTFLYRF